MALSIVGICLLSLQLKAALGSVGNDSFYIRVNTDGSYSIQLGNTTWLNSAPTFFNSDGEVFTRADGSLILINTMDVIGTDNLGKWKASNFHYVAGSTQIMAGIKQYTDPYRPCVIFSQTYLYEGRNTSASSENAVIGGFPGFNVEGQKGDLGYLSYGGMMVADTDKVIGLWHNTTVNIEDGLEGGPIAIYDKHGNVVIISPFSQFMAASNWHDGVLGGSVYWGIMGDVDRVPAGFTMETIVYYGNAGINKAFQGWGDILRTKYGKSSSYKRSDFTINYLGYWTDNGAFYYYNTESKKNYEQTMLDVKQYTDSLNVPFRYIQYDSWWYPKGIIGGVILWEPMTDVFPHGLQYLYNKTGWPAAAHNRYWSSKTKYAKQNGGQFDFIVELETALPVEERFWDYLLRRASKWGLILYEQDWLNVQFKHTQALQSNISLGRDWLIQMGRGAQTNGMPIQYCMSNARHVLQSLEIPAVTQARASDDYSPGEDQWKIGISSLFADAVGLAPFKDTFWTTQTQPGNPYHGRQETQPGLNAVVATLSTGPVGPSDMIGGTNVSLLMRCCNADGLILKPSKPATAIDAQLLQASFQDGRGPDGEVWSTYTQISGQFYGIILAADLKTPYSLTPQAAGFGQFFEGPNIVYSYLDFTPKPFGMNDSITLEGCSTINFCLYYTSPVIKLGSKEVCILGEVDKWVPLSPQRIRTISTGSDIIMSLAGSPEEKLRLAFIENGKLRFMQCTLDSAGTATLRYMSGLCS
ncbi:uncharacterized protein LOC135480876 [Liolophura sinensis]|uniref:uncharacterized protein LOC135480876 n=1 Tax=Liolophura sinensis TaxID=3198878 RepID=UPI0031589B9A